MGLVGHLLKVSFRQKCPLRLHDLLSLDMSIWALVWPRGQCFHHTNTMSKEFTIEEVKKHNKETDLWIVWRGKVLDLTKFVNEHPGGVDVLMETAGGDATQGFEDIGHSSDAIKLAEDHAIGTLKGAVVSASAAPKVPFPSILHFNIPFSLL